MRSKKALFNILTSILFQLALITYGFIVPKIVIQKYGSDVNGLVSSITKFLSYIVLLEAGFAPVVKYALFKPIAKNDRKKILKILASCERFFKKITYIFIGYIIVLLFIYPLIINNQFDYIFTISLIVIISIATIFEYYFGLTYSIYLQSIQKSYIINIVQFTSYVLCTIAIFFISKLNCSIYVFKLVSSFFFILRPLVLNFYVKKKYNIYINTKEEKFDIKQKWDALAQHIAYVININTDVVLLTIFSTLKEVSVYSVYYLVVSGVKNLIFSFTSGIDASFGDMIARGEHDNLNKKFGMYEICFYSLATIIFTSSILLITPFVKVYIDGVNDVNYIRYTFGYLIVISEFLFAIRDPYQRLINASGHFKQTNKIALIEATSNIVISIILLNIFGLIGVVIGTIIAVSIRFIYFIFYINKNILNRSNFISIKKILFVVIESLLICYVCKYLPYLSNSNYFNWVINGVMVFTLSVVIVLTFNILFFKNEFNILFDIIKNILKKNKIKE